MFANIVVENGQGNTLFTSSRTIRHAGDIGGVIHELTREFPECVVRVTYGGRRARTPDAPLRDTLRAIGARRIDDHPSPVDIAGEGNIYA